MVAILIIPIVKLFNTQIYLFIQSFQACVSPPITAVFLWGLIFKFVNTRAAMMSLIFGEIIGLFRLSLDGLVNSGIISGPFWVMIANVNFLHFSIFLFVLTSILILSISLATTKANQIVPENWYVLAADSTAGTKISLGIKERFINSVFITIFLFAVIIVVWGLWT